MQFVKQSAPYIKSKDSTTRTALAVIIALIPTVIYSLVIFKLSALRNVLLSIVIFELCDFIYLLIKNKVPYDGHKRSVKEHWANQKKAISIDTFLFPLISGLIYSLILPVEMNPSYMIYPALIAGAVFGDVVAKIFFGGIGKNIFNPAASGMAFFKVCFGSKIIYPENSYYANAPILEGSNSAVTPLENLSLTTGALDLSSYSVLDLILGKCPGMTGDIFSITILIGLVWLVVTKTIDWRIPLAYLGVFALDMLLAGLIIQNTPMGAANEFSALKFTGYELFSGSLLFAACFMATDPVTSPNTRPGSWMYGLFLGGITAVIRLFASDPDGAIYAILLGNIAAGCISYYRWNKDRFNWKNITVIASIAVVPLLIIIWACSVLGFNYTASDEVALIREVISL